MSDLTEKTRCPFCDNDPFDYVDNGLGMVPVAVTCCHLGRDYWDDNGDEITKKAGDEITGSRVTIARLRSLYADLVEVLRKAPNAVTAAYQQAHAEWQMHDRVEARHEKVVSDFLNEARAALSRARAKEDICPRIATVDLDNTSPEQGEADGHLIAAAPDMKQALEAAYAFILDQYSDPKAEALDGEPISAEARPVFKSICDALAKSEGDT